MPVVSIFLTEKCNPKCKNCSALIPSVKNPQNYEKDRIINDLRVLSNSVDAIQLVSLFGGEPFLHRDIIEICEETAKLKNVNEINIITNGTIIPSHENMLRLKKSISRVIISNYKVCIDKTKELIKKFELYKIPYNLMDSSEYWYVHNQPQKHNRGDEENKKIFKNCQWGEQNCITLKNSNLYKCILSSVYMSLNLIPPDERDYTNIFESEDIGERIKKFINNTEGISACDYCGIDFSTRCLRGQQI